MAAAKALEVKINVQGRDFPDLDKYTTVIDGINRQIVAQSKEIVEGK